MEKESIVNTAKICHASCFSTCYVPDYLTGVVSDYLTVFG